MGAIRPPRAKAKNKKKMRHSARKSSRKNTNGLGLSEINQKLQHDMRGGSVRHKKRKIVNNSSISFKDDDGTQKLRKNKSNRTLKGSP